MDDDGDTCVDYGAAIPVGCMNAEELCTPSVEIASAPAPDDEDLDGVAECMVFVSGCIPYMWELCSGEDIPLGECSED